MIAYLIKIINEMVITDYSLYVVCYLFLLKTLVTLQIAIAQFLLTEFTANITLYVRLS